MPKDQTNSTQPAETVPVTAPARQTLDELLREMYLQAALRDFDRSLRFA